MQDSQPGTAKRRLPKWVVLSLLSAAVYGLPVFPGVQILGWEPSAAMAQTVEDAEPEVLLEVEGSLEAGDPTLEDGSLFDEYTFTGRAGETVSITLESLEFDTYLLLLDKNGERLAANDDIDLEVVSITQNSWITLTLPTDGEYRILANAYQEWGRGNYRLTVVSGQALPTLSNTALMQANANQLFEQGIQQISISQFREAITSWRASLRIYREIGDVLNEGRTLGNIGIALNSLGQYQEATEIFEQRLDLARSAGDRLGEARVLGNLGSSYSSLGQYQQALELNHDALDIFQELSNQQGVARSLEGV